MHYQPSLPEDNHNISRTNPLKEFLTLLAGVVGVLLVTYILLGFLVDFAVNRISPEMETELFNHTPLSLLPTYSDPQDPRQEKLQQLTDELRGCAGIERPITLHLQDSDIVNAVAMPGGHIIIFTGLLDVIATENGLSFVLAHELGHFKNRDHLRGLGRGLVLMALATTVTGPSSSLTRLVTQTMQFSQAQYSQDRESHADETGLNTLHCYYGHVGGASDFFEAMAKTQDDAPLSHYLGSHPQMQERLTALKQQARDMKYPFQKPIPLIIPPVRFKTN